MAAANPHEDRITGTLSRAAARGGYSERIHPTTPLDEVMLAEDLLRRRVAGGGEDGAECESCGNRVEELRELVHWIFGDGPHPWHAMRRLYFLAHTFYPGLVLNMTEEDLSNLFGETKANASAALNRLFSGLKVNIPGHKSEEACRTYGRIRANNRNRAGGSVLVTGGPASESPWAAGD